MDTGTVIRGRSFRVVVYRGTGREFGNSPAQAGWMRQTVSGLGSVGELYELSVTLSNPSATVERVRGVLLGDVGSL